jgi:hypothetical protein
MRPFKRVLAFRLMKAKGFIHYVSGSDKRRTREIVRELNKVFIQKKTNNEFD